MASRLNGLFGAVVAGSLLLSSTAAVAAAPAPVQQPDPWAVLTAMSQGAPAAAMCGSAAAAGAQGNAGCVLPVTDAPPPPPPPPVPPPVVEGPGGGISPLFIALIAIAAGIGIFLAINNSGNANSPA